MKQQRHTVDQIISKLRRADVELGKGCWRPGGVRAHRRGVDRGLHGLLIAKVMAIEERHCACGDAVQPKERAISNRITSRQVLARPGTSAKHHAARAAAARSGPPKS
jgi:hypothetical protein